MTEKVDDLNEGSFASDLRLMLACEALSGMNTLGHLRTMTDRIIDLHERYVPALMTRPTGDHRLSRRKG